MTYLDRIKLELQEITFSDNELTILAQENGINNPTSEYDPSNNQQKEQYIQLCYQFRTILIIKR